uniref:Growth arrest specific 7 n=1 Tax=Sander lucioperca TaxID=283035 RepID=A0A8C9XYE2_SANLU
MSGSFCKSLYPFSGEQHRQGLSFQAGDIIRVVQALPGGWWEGERDGVRGWFPSSYVHVLEVRTESNFVFTSYLNLTQSSLNGSGCQSDFDFLSLFNFLFSLSLSLSLSLSFSLSFSINCVTFPTPACMPEQQLLKPNEWSYCDFFWTDKKDPQGNGCVTGFEVLLQKQLKGKQMQKEMAEFIRERIKIEEDYAKNLSKLSQNPLASQEEGTLGEAWAQLKKSLADEAEVHLKFSSKLQSEVEKPFLAFRENFKKDMKRFDHHIADLRKQLVGRYAAVEKARKALADRQKELEVKTQQLEIKLSNKIEEDIKKARRKSTQAGDELMRCVDLYNQSQSKWFEEMVTTSLELERLEVERVEMIRQHLCQYTTLRHETDMFNQSTMEPVDQLLQGVDPARDRELWVRENQTGEIRPVDIEI